MAQWYQCCPLVNLHDVLFMNNVEISTVEPPPLFLPFFFGFLLGMKSIYKNCSQNLYEHVMKINPMYIVLILINLLYILLLIN